MEVVRKILLLMKIQNKIVKVVIRKCEITSYQKISSFGVKAFCRSMGHAKKILEPMSVTTNPFAFLVSIH